jgi:hypothetical protein
MARRRRAELLLLLGSLLFVASLGVIGELCVRTFSGIDLLGNSKNLFVANAYGPTFGNTPNVEAISYGKTVYTDEHGFRVPKGGVPGDAGKTEAILILGDSVGFGAGVEEGDTLAGRLRARFAAKRIYNSSVIGYATNDYHNVVDAFVPQHPEVTAVALVLCLNDVTPSSAQNIDSYLKTKSAPVPEQNLTETLRSFAWISRANDYLRARSKLYLLFRHRLLGTQQREWKTLLHYYSDELAPDVEQSANDIAAVAAELRQRSVRFAVVIVPFEHQLSHPADPESEVPQKTIGALLSKASVRYIDARPYFSSENAATDYFLAYDPMHLSSMGHRVIADVIAEALER